MTMPLFMHYSHYYVIRYVPNQATGEFANIGIAIVSESHTPKVAFLADWTRTVAFTGVTVEELESIKKDWIDSTSSLTKEKLDDIATNWQNTIQLTPARGSIGRLEQTFCWARELFLSQD